MILLVLLEVVVSKTAQKVRRPPEDSCYSSLDSLISYSQSITGPFAWIGWLPLCVLFMIGHSKWAKIKHQKGANDAKRAQAFAKISREITEASRLAKGDLSNIRLAAAISRAKVEVVE